MRNATSGWNPRGDEPLQGRTDTLILGGILERHGLAFVDGERARFWELCQTLTDSFSGRHSVS